ncbi:hypothetical protein [Planomonospora venezuelensis]|uniref:Uncharacterized protein n=1 Tax=Planomonospora venezuelensis TaxID=1999 RepID=A0A841D9Q3_PLAVE|nr:hypothetical protein [Planomonospora venezuelensis]MBB5965048.1 hypothetical protein [Planomonospora venezuelensis]GIN05035.1 hypothetical protein Pve01_66930 [Planomonospora venezuelensis]
MAKKITRKAGLQRLRDELAMAEALEPIEDELHEAKEAYREALASGDPDTIAEAKARKQAAANHINETRTWLRRERQITKLQATVVELERILAGPILVKNGKDDAREDAQARAEYEAALAVARADLDEMSIQAVKVRAELAALTEGSN